jgi:hypothetical protein
MTDLSTDVKVAGVRAQPTQVGKPTEPASNVTRFALVAGAAFVLYWSSSFVLEARNATTHFGADSWYFAELAQGNVFARISSNYFLDRVARFHPTTVVMAAAWMQVLSPLTQWVTSLHLLKAMFAAVGAAGVWAAMSAFAAVVPRGYAMLLGIIYANSFGVWYFSSIEESKIVTASLSALYIASYLQVRKRWTMRGAVLLTAILLIACLNEMVSGFLVIVPVVDTLVQRGWDWRQGRWIAVHALAGPIAFAIIEGVIYGRVVAVSHPEGSSHFGMLIAYVSTNYYSFLDLYSFVVNWLFFNVAAPTNDASYGVQAGANYKGYAYKGYFAPALSNYFFSPASVGVAALFGAMIVASVLPRYRAQCRDDGANAIGGLLLALSAFTLLRGTFFFVFNPREPMLFSPAVTLPHMLMIGILFVASNLPAKHILLGGFAALLLIANGAFIVGR